MICRRLWEPSADNHSVGISSRSVADDAVDVKTVLAAIDEFLSYRHREIIDIVRETRDECIPAGIGHRLRLRVQIRIIDLARIKGLVVVQPAARDGIRRKIPGSALVSKEIALLVILVARLILHVVTAAEAKEAVSSKQ